MAEWFDVKYKLGIPFPNLPYIIDGEVKISECFAVMKYLCRKNNNRCLPKTAKDFAYAENLEAICKDVWLGFIQVCYAGASPEKWFLEDGKQTFERLADFMKSGPCGSQDQKWL